MKQEGTWGRGASAAPAPKWAPRSSPDLDSRGERISCSVISAQPPTLSCKCTFSHSLGRKWRPPCLSIVCTAGVCLHAPQAHGGRPWAESGACPGLVAARKWGNESCFGDEPEPGAGRRSRNNAFLVIPARQGGLWVTCVSARAVSFSHDVSGRWWPHPTWHMVQCHVSAPWGSLRPAASGRPRSGSLSSQECVYRSRSQHPWFSCKGSLLSL